MGKRTIRWLVMLGVLCAAATGTQAQQCDDGVACTANDICSDGMCSGTFQPGGSCDDGDECTVNDRCQMDPDVGPTCKGDPGEPGTPCQHGCGVCQQLSPIPLPDLPLVCSPVVNNGDPCDLGINCFTGSCQVFGQPPFAVAICTAPAPKSCPDTDDNPCTDNCNFATGQCERDAPKCIPVCEACNQATGQCEPANQGGACEDFNACTSQSRCGTAFGRGFCLAGEPTVTGDTPTPTATPRDETPTPTVQATTPASPLATATSTATRTSGTPPTPGACIGDCNDNKVVAVNELVIGVNILLGSAQVSQCPSFDVNANGSVAVNELVGGVNALLNGCV